MPDTTLDCESGNPSPAHWECWLAADGSLLWVSPSIESVTGYSVETCHNMSEFPFSLAADRDGKSLWQILSFERSQESKNAQSHAIRHADGEWHDATVSWQGLCDAQGNVCGIRLCVKEPLAPQAEPYHTRMQEALSQLVRSGIISSGQLDTAFKAITESAVNTLNTTRVGIWLLGADRNHIECRDLYDLRSHSHMAGAKVPRSRYPAYFSALDQDRVVAAGDACRDPRTAELADDYLVPLGIRAMMDAPIVWRGKTVGVLCHEHIDQTRSWSALETGFASSLADLVAMALEADELVKSETQNRKLADILEATPDFVGTADADGTPTYVNPAGRRLIGLSPTDALEQWHATQLYSDWARQQRDQVAIPEALRTGAWSGESEFLGRDGTPFPVSQVVIAHKDERGKLRSLSTVARDLREWKENQAALRERERFLATLLANLPGVAYRRRNAPGWPMEYISQGCLELTGYTAEALAADQPNYTEVVHPEDRSRVYAEVDAALAEHRYFEVEYRLKRADGRELWVWSKGRGIYDENGRLTAREGFIGDIDERVRARMELENLNAQLEAKVAERTAKLAEANQHLEAFAYSVSHDLKAPLRGIDGYSRLLLEDYRQILPEEGQRFLDNIRAGSERMNQLIDDLLTYSRLERRDLNRTRIPLANIFDRIIAEREHQIRESGAEIFLNLADHVVLADIEAFMQAARNLVDNALKFGRNASPPLIKIEATTSAQGNGTMISVRDNGCGFDMKYHDRIFDIFQRLHRMEDYPGTGVGLAIVRKAVERMGGRVWAESEIGAGAAFFMEFPI